MLSSRNGKRAICLFDFLFPFSLPVLLFVLFFFLFSLDRKRRGKEEKRGNEEGEKRRRNLKERKEKDGIKNLGKSGRH